MESLIEKQKKFSNKKKLANSLKIQNSEERHLKNMENVEKKLEEKDNLNKDKIFKTYMNFYFSRKDREKQIRLKTSENNHKTMLKAEKLEELERKEEEKTKDLLKKLKTIESRKKEILKHKNDKLMSFNERRQEYKKDSNYKKQSLLKEFNEARVDILDYQSALLQKSANKNNIITLKKLQVNEKTINEQMNFEKNIKNFYKKLELIKSENVMRLPLDERRKIFLKLKRKEAEKKRKEEEEKLLNMM